MSDAFAQTLDRLQTMIATEISSFLVAGQQIGIFFTYEMQHALWLRGRLMRWHSQKTNVIAWSED